MTDLATPEEKVKEVKMANLDEEEEEQWKTPKPHIRIIKSGTVSGETAGALTVFADPSVSATSLVTTLVASTERSGTASIKMFPTPDELKPPEVVRVDSESASEVPTQHSFVRRLSQSLVNPIKGLFGGSSKVGVE
jgi:hypothetical protein